MKKTALTLLTGAALLLAGSAFAREVKVGTECTNPPFNFRTAGGELTGFDVDLAREIGKRAGFELQFVCQAFEGLIPALSARKFDLILASLSITEARQKSIDFSIPYRSSTGRFVGPNASKCARDAISGTTPPYRVCSSTLEATSSARRETRTDPSFSEASSQMPTPVSSQELSMARMMVITRTLPVAWCTHLPH